MSDLNLQFSRCFSSLKTIIVLFILLGLVQLIIFYCGRWYLTTSPDNFCLEGAYCESLHDENNVHRQLRLQAEVISQLESIHDQLKRNKKNLYTYSIHRHLLDLRKYVAGSEGPLANTRWTKGNSCEEIFLGQEHDKDRYLYNWKMINCHMNEQSVYQYITFCFLLFEGYDNHRLIHTLSTLATNHTQLLIGLIGKVPLPVNFKKENIKLYSFRQGTSEGKVWNSLFSKAKTPYVFVGRDVESFDYYSNFIRPALLLDYYGEIGVTTFAVREPDGVWSLNCYQVQTLQSEMIIEAGYHRSFNESLVCDYSAGPFLARSNVLKETAFDESFKRPYIFLDFFLRIRDNGVVIMDMPDFMALITNQEKLSDVKREYWLPFARKWKISSLDVLGNTINFRCQDIDVYCRNTFDKSNDFPVSMCCWQELKLMMKIIFDFIQGHDTACEGDSVPLRAVSRLVKGLPIDLRAEVYCQPEGIQLFKTNAATLGTKEYKLIISGDKKHLIYKHKSYPGIKVYILPMDSSLKNTASELPSLSKCTAERALKRIKEDVII